MNNEYASKNSSSSIQAAADKVAQVLAETGATYQEVDVIFALSKTRMVITASANRSETYSE